MANVFTKGLFYWGTPRFINKVEEYSIHSLHRERALMRKKIPLIDGLRPNQDYVLDSASDLRKLGLPSQVQTKIADRYIHYQDCRFAVIEFKSSTIGKAIRQIEATVQMLAGVGKKVDLAIVVMDKPNKYEMRIYKRDRRSKELVNAWNEKSKKR